MSQSRRADGGSLPHAAALGFDVVGRRAPTCVTSAAARTLNRLDLPLPVAPAKATTACPPAIDVRTAVLAMAASARPTPSMGKQPAPESRADRNASVLAWIDSADTSGPAPIDSSVVKADPGPMALGLIAPPGVSSRCLDIGRRGLDPSSLPLTDLKGGNGRVQTALLIGIQLLRPSHQLGPSLSYKDADCLATEDGLQDPLGQDCRTAGSSHLAARRPARLTEHQEHEDDANTVSTNGKHPGSRAPVVGLGTDYLEDLCLPDSDQPLDVTRALWCKVDQLWVHDHQRRSPWQMSPSPENGRQSPA